MVPLVLPMVPMVPISLTVGLKFCRQPRVWAKLLMPGNYIIQDGGQPMVPLVQLALPFETTNHYEFLSANAGNRSIEPENKLC